MASNSDSTISTEYPLSLAMDSTNEPHVYTKENEVNPLKTEDTKSGHLAEPETGEYLKMFEANLSLLKQMGGLDLNKHFPDMPEKNECLNASELENGFLNGNEKAIEAKTESENMVKTSIPKRHPAVEEENDFVAPSDELADKIVSQVESYFTDFNIMKDSFLLKHVRRNKEGYISLKLVASFRRVKVLTKDWRIVRHSLYRSEKLQLNEEGTKIRRTAPVPNFEDTSCAKTVLVFNVPDSSASSSGVTELLSRYGKVISVTTVAPGSCVPDICTKRCLSYYSDLADKMFALVEFVSYDSAVSAMQDNEQHQVSGLKIVPLLSDLYKNKSNSPKIPSNSPKSDSSSSDKEGKRSIFKKKKQQRSRTRVDELKEGYLPSTSSDSDNFSPPNRMSPKMNVYDYKGSYRRSKGHSKNSSPNEAGENGRSKIGNDADDNSWMLKRNSAKYGSKQSSPSNNHRLPPNVIRLPRGPDGTNGFHDGRRKDSELQVSVKENLVTEFEKIQVPRGPESTNGLYDLCRQDSEIRVGVKEQGVTEVENKQVPRKPDGTNGFHDAHPKDSEPQVEDKENGVTEVEKNYVQ